MIRRFIRRAWHSFPHGLGFGAGVLLALYLFAAFGPLK